MNHLNLDEQARVREHHKNFSVRTRNDVADQEDQILAELRDKALTARGNRSTPESVGVRAASQKLSQLVWRARGGETFVITINGVESAQLCPVVPRIEAKEEV